MEAMWLVLIGLAVLLTLGIKAVMGQTTPKKLAQADLVLLTHNSAQQIEGLIRTSLRSARKGGQDLRVYVIDEGSDDDTLQIVNKFKQNGLYIKVLNDQEGTQAFLSAVESCYHYLSSPFEPERQAAGDSVVKQSRDDREEPAASSWGREIRMVDMRRRN